MIVQLKTMLNVCVFIFDSSLRLRLEGAKKWLKKKSSLLIYILQVPAYLHLLTI